MWEIVSEYFNSKFIVLIIILTISFTYGYLKLRVYNYWKDHKIPHETPTALLGNVPFQYLLGKMSLGSLLTESYNKYKDHPFHGIYVFQLPVLVLNDPELIKTILVKEFARFTDRGWFSDESLDPMSNIIFLQRVDKWKRLRGKFSPAFAPSKLKQFYPLMKEIGDKMVVVCNKKLQVSDTLEVRDILGRYFTDIISSVVYGFDCDSLNNEKSEFRNFGKKAFAFGKIKMLFSVFFPRILEMIGQPFFDHDVRKFFVEVFTHTLEYRREKKVARKDFLNVLMQLMDGAKLEQYEKLTETDKQDTDKLSDMEAAAQAFNFFLGGVETSVSTVTHCLLELSMEQEIQEKLQNEIDKFVVDSAGLTYDKIMEMEYLDMVLNETTRRHAAVDFLNRECTQDFPIPNTDFTIPKGMRILISIPGIQNDAKYFPNPEKFDPSRFDKKNSSSRDSSAYLAFGDGPRNCIATRFGLLQSKQALISLLYNYKFRLSDKTKLPIEYGTDNLIPTPKYGIYLTVEKRRKS